MEYEISCRSKYDVEIILDLTQTVNDIAAQLQATLRWIGIIVEYHQSEMGLIKPAYTTKGWVTAKVIFPSALNVKVRLRLQLKMSFWWLDGGELLSWGQNEADHPPAVGVCLPPRQQQPISEAAEEPNQEKVDISMDNMDIYWKADVD